MKIDTNQAKFESIHIPLDEGWYDSKKCDSIQRGKNQDQGITMIQFKKVDSIHNDMIHGIMNRIKMYGKLVETLSDTIKKVWIESTD